MAANSVGPNVAAAAANIIGLAPNGLTHDAGLLECGVCTLPAFGASAPYAPSAAHVPVAGNKRMAEWQPECIVPKAPRLVDMDSLPAWPQCHWALPQRWAAPVCAEEVASVAIVTPPFECQRTLSDLLPAVSMESLVHDAAQPDIFEHDRSLTMIGDEDEDAPPMLSAPPNTDGCVGAENWWASAGYFAHVEGSDP